jgi:iron(III) transport system substrate-binding protein
MTLRRFLLAAIACGAAFAAGSTTASAQSRELVVYCTVQEEWCRPMMAAFERESGIRISMTRKSSGETYAQVRAEASNPRGDVWWGGTGDPHMQAAQEQITEQYRSPMLAELHPWAVRHAEQTQHRSVGIYSGALGYSYNAQQLQRRNLPEPRCWADLTKPEYRDEVQVADPNSSGTAYTMLATFAQLMGEDQAFTFLRQMHRNVNQYTRSGAAPARAVATGESLIGITFLHDAVSQVVTGAQNVRIVAPCEGTGYEIGAMSIIRGARNMENARRFYDWALGAPAQAIGAAQGNSYQLPSNRNAPIHASAPRFENIRLIDYDFARWGDAANRTRLLDRFNREIRAAAR